MGLLIRTGGGVNFSMSYKAFGQLRRDLAQFIGLEAALDGTMAWPKVDTSLEQQPMLALALLLNHSDSEGYLPSHQCERLTPALTQVIAQWTHDSDKRSWVEPLSNLRDCCRFAADNHIALEFT
ncbi:hypothetical protein QRB41_26460 [Mycobacterium avium subsp. hominissuis]|uniref:hypothetical protein n=1 Tax=Mycobacterium avium TaxID=1764 RepID=UPI0026667E18|nr:hypothetical protein [Mycobacterium avium]MDO2386873.1 hypothetical protein [Mycobacterium avium subsp. hominissuis]